MQDVLKVSAYPGVLRLWQTDCLGPRNGALDVVTNAAGALGDHRRDATLLAILDVGMSGAIAVVFVVAPLCAVSTVHRLESLVGVAADLRAGHIRIHKVPPDRG